MHRFRWLLVSALVLGCSDQGPVGERFLVVMNGDKETTPVTTLTSGTASLALANNTLSYSVLLQNAAGVTMAHLHAGAAGVDGPVLVTLYDGPTTGLFSGQLAAGSVTASALTSVSMDSLRTLLRTGNAYLNVHTTSHPAGEIRGQVLAS